MTFTKQIYDLPDHGVVLPPEGEYWIAPGATVIGRVELKRNASVWYGAVLRGDNDPITIGENTNVQDGAILHADPGRPLDLGANVTVGHRVVLHGCTVDDNSLIGMGAILLNGARIGRNCMVGAGALVTENREFPDGVLILGSPARVSRSLSEAEIAGLAASAAHYVQNWKRHAAGLTPRR